MDATCLRRAVLQVAPHHEKDEDPRDLATMMLYPSSPEAAVRFLKFVNASPTPFHAVSNAAVRLEHAGFQKVGSQL